ncbi:CYR1 [Candida pseudojiufengensis]|uniref:CYR1 n=1 Tax=Candida pseudojiufengensis TaxID=497109 RepID=UPI0022245A8B|nr:CYR1 [Candida pseudojiufengensis]KAI5959957.1 CYR1 [Candida pseudojiufengensis]
MSFLKRDKSKTNLNSAGQRYYEEPPSPTTNFTSNDPFYDPSKISRSMTTTPDINNEYSPRSSIISIPQIIHSSNNNNNSQNISNINSNTNSTTNTNSNLHINIKDNYKGFHRPKSIGNIPPLLHPIKPKFKKKSSSLFNKLISSKQKDGGNLEEEQQLDEYTTNTNRGSIGSSSISGTSNNNTRFISSSSEGLTSPAQSVSSSRANSITSAEEQPHPQQNQSSTTTNEQRKSNSSSSSSSHSKHKFRLPSLSDYHPQHGSQISAQSLQMTQADSNQSKPPPQSQNFASSLPTNSPENVMSIDLNLDEMQDIIKSKDSLPVPKQNWKAPDSWDVKQQKIEEEINEEPQEEESNKLIPIENTTLPPSENTLPSLYGTRQTHVVNNVVDPRPSHIVKIFKEDNTFTTILCPLETTTTELLNTVQKKFFLESASNYQLSVHVGNCVKVLESFEKPIKIQMGLLLLSGYTDEDNLRIIGRGDLSFVCKFVVENIYLRSLTHDEETILSKNYVDVNISALNLKNIPIIFHQHTYEIEKLNVSENPSIYIPLDFIQSCTNLTSINFARNGSSKFPINFLEAKNLTHLNLESNFIDDLPIKINMLTNLTHLKLNSNQLSQLPKSFGELKNLVSLNLSSNYFNMYPEPINDLEKLIELDLSYNDLSYIPETITNLKNLQKLNLCTNKLSKNLPNFLSNFKALKRLDIRYNQITNVDILGELPNLEVLYASRNSISAFCDKMQNLRLLHFDKNPITELQFVFDLQMLNILDLSKAKITSMPSEFISKIPNIEKLVLDKNHLVNLPNEIGQLNKLSYLSIYSNNLQILPNSFGNLLNLQYLDLHSNNIQSLPGEIWNLKSLMLLNVASNNLTSFPKPPFAIAKRISSSTDLREMPSSGSMADSLSSLIISDNRLNDECFEAISFLIALKTLNVSYNDLIEIPEGSLARMNRLTDLYLSGNDLSTIPADDLEHIKTLRLIYLNNNKLVSLPAELSKLINLQHFDVGSNQLKYNISNWPYDWSWHWNKNLKYLNFSGNKRFEIKQSHVKNPETGEDFDSLLVLDQLKVLGLIDVTLTTTSVPDQSVDKRIRTTASELENIGYGVSDTMGQRTCVSNRDLFIQKFRGNENELLICAFDGKHGAPNQGHRISSIVKNSITKNLTEELHKIDDNPDKVHIALRRAFLSFNKEVNGVLLAKKSHTFTPLPQYSKDMIDLNLIDDARTGCAVTVIYIRDKKLYSANIGDIESLLCQNNGNFRVLTNVHRPTNRQEFERIRASGGYVSGSGDLDGDLAISRGAGFFSYLPHTHSGPDVSELTLTPADDLIVIATKVLWDYITHELAVDILRQEKNDPMIAAQKLRDFAICYGATDKITVIVVTFGGKKVKSNALYNNLGREADYFKRRRADRVGDSSLRRLESEIEPPIGELALVFTDIKNSTLLWDSYPAPMRSAIKTHNSIMRRQLRIIGGYEVKTEGDAFMVAFPSPTSALLWCFNVQQNLLTADWPTEILETDQCCEVTDGKGNVIYRGLSVRMGIHWGSPVCEPDVVTGRMDYFGPMVNRASRISAIADGGQIAVSSDFLDEMRALTAIHDDIKNNVKTVADAYQGNENAGKIIERELTSLDDHGSNFYKMGERKLKGLEIPEMITLVYSSRLKLRFDIFQKRLDIDESHSTRVIGTIPIECITAINNISLRLENLLSFINGGTYTKEGLKQNQKLLDVNVQDLLNSVTRIENSVASLYLRQIVNDKRYGFNNQPLSQVLNELTKMIKH